MHVVDHLGAKVQYLSAKIHKEIKKMMTQQKLLFFLIDASR